MGKIGAFLPQLANPHAINNSIANTTTTTTNEIAKANSFSQNHIGSNNVQTTFPTKNGNTQKKIKPNIISKFLTLLSKLPSPPTLT